MTTTLDLDARLTATPSIGFTTANCSLGRLLLAATERGVCSVKLGDADATLEAELREQFAAAFVERDDARLGPWLAHLLQLLAGQSLTEAVPVDVQGTAFQRQVWQELAAIPAGQTRTYSEVAAAIGRPAAVRAVAAACAANPVAVIVPCHRVVRNDGSLAGYRWGVERKRALLDAELTNASIPQFDAEV